MNEMPSGDRIREMSRDILDSFHPDWLSSELLGNTRSAYTFHEILGRAYHAGLHGLRNYVVRGPERREGKETKTVAYGKRLITTKDLTKVITDRRDSREQRVKVEFAKLAARSPQIDVLAQALFTHDNMQPRTIGKFLLKKRQKGLLADQKALLLNAMVTAYRQGWDEQGHKAEPSPRSPRGAKRA